MDFKTAPEISQALHAAADFAIYGYYTPMPAYYEAISAWQQRRHGFACQADWIVQVPNIVYALYQLVNAFSNPGDGVIVQTPVYPPFFHAVERQQRRLVTNPCWSRTALHHRLRDLAAKAADPGVRLMILCSPHNPVGRVWTRDELAEVVRICRQHDVLLISDEIHADLVFAPNRHTVLAGLGQDVADHCVICTAPSKTFNLAGLATANLIIPTASCAAGTRTRKAAPGSTAPTTSEPSPARPPTNKAKPGTRPCSPPSPATRLFLPKRCAMNCRSLASRTLREPTWVGSTCAG